MEDCNIFRVILATVVIFCSAAVESYDIVPPIPIASPEPGIRYNPYGPFEPDVKIEIFLDPNCGDSAAGLPVIKSVADYYGNQLVNLVVQFTPLPYHRNAFLSAQGAFLIQANEPLSTFNYLGAVLAQNANFSTANTVDMSETEVLEMLADIAVASTPIDRSFFIQNIGLYRSPVVQSWKYSIKRLNAATPSYSVNGVDLAITGVPDYPTFDDWIKYLDPIVNSFRISQ